MNIKPPTYFFFLLLFLAFFNQKSQAQTYQRISLHGGVSLCVIPDKSDKDNKPSYRAQFNGKKGNVYIHAMKISDYKKFKYFDHNTPPELLIEYARDYYSPIDSTCIFYDTLNMGKIKGVYPFVDLIQTSTYRHYQGGLGFSSGRKRFIIANGYIYILSVHSNNLIINQKKPLKTRKNTALDFRRLVRSMRFPKPLTKPKPLPPPPLSKHLVYIPDSNFKAALVMDAHEPDIDLNNDGQISKEEASLVENLQLFDKNIYNLKGIEAFTALKKLDCSKNQLKRLDLSKNKTLEHLNCAQNLLYALEFSNNPLLRSLNCAKNLLRDVKIEENPALTELDCSKNHLKFLSLEGNKKLTLLNCSFNKLSQLELSSLKKLKKLYCSGNLLSQVEVQSNNNLEELYCSKNSLSQLDVKNNNNLKELACSDNLLTQLDLQNNNQLEYFNCSYNQFTHLNLSTTPKLNSLNCSFNALTQLDLKMNLQLRFLRCYYNKLKELDLHLNSELYSLNCSSNQLETLILDKEYTQEETITYSNFPKETDTIISIKNVFYIVSEIDTIPLYFFEPITVSIYKTCLELRVLNCSFNQLTKLDPRPFPELEHLNCNHNQLEKLYFRNPKLLYLDCANNKISDENLKQYMRRVN